ncbi:MAG: hypothetical protein IKK02_06050 [Tidjanibacter sp.]|nr:hypothetical protein [Tidjanibacter sp.]MBR7102548.1 hypothetical protein [Tidjanibacter sp.]
MKKLIYIATLLTAMVMVGCEKFEDPKPYQAWTDEMIIADGYQIVSVNDLKKVYYDEFANDYSANSITIEDKLAIKCKVISTDQFGNVYRTLYLQDYSGPAGGGIEVKVGKTSMYNDYKMGQVVYVKADGLVLGDYRRMLSLGTEPTSASYANDYLDIQPLIDAHLLRGEVEGLKESDYLVVNASNVDQYFPKADKSVDPKYFGTLVRLEGITCAHGYHSGEKASFPSYQDDDYNNLTKLPDGTPFNTWAYNHDNKQYYGSTLFKYNNTNYFIARTSGYCKFAQSEVPANGTKCDITAIVSFYCSKSGGYAKYQLVLNNDLDVQKAI